MKDEQKVFIRGGEGRGKEVIKMLEDCGGKNKYGWKCEDSHALYFINHSGEIDGVGDFWELGKVIMDNYRELHLPDQWKDGDILATDEGEFCVLKGTASQRSPYFNVYVAFTRPETHRWHLATEEEVAKFREYLHDKEGQDWDAEKKQLVDWKWKPKEGDTYYYVDECTLVEDRTFEGRVFDERHYEVGNCFRTREEAEAMAEKYKQLLKRGWR